jgi:hypothetical protein
VNVAQQLEHAARGALIEIPGGFVREEDGVMFTSARAIAAPLSPPESSVGRNVLRGESTCVSTRFTLGAIESRRAPVTKGEGHVLFRRPVLEQAEILEHDPEPAAKPWTFLLCDSD